MYQIQVKLYLKIVKHKTQNPVRIRQHKHMKKMNKYFKNQKIIDNNLITQQKVTMINQIKRIYSKDAGVKAIIL